MTTMTIAAAPTQGAHNDFWATSPTITMRRWWGVLGQVTHGSQLWSMSDRELKDIGLNRSQVMGA